MTAPDMNSTEVIAAIETQLGGELTTGQVRSVLSALNAIREGDPVGKVVRDPQTGMIAHRVSHLGVDQWRMSGPDGIQQNDLQPTLPGWDVLYEPTT